MTKTISFDLSKRLDQLGLLRDVETEYYWALDLEDNWIILSRDSKIPTQKEIKTLTTDEAFEFIGKQICHFEMPYPNAGILNGGTVYGDKIEANNLCEYFEKCITYLLDNNLIGQTELN